MQRSPDIDKLFENLVQGDRVALGQAITLVESSLEAHRPLAQALMNRCLNVPASTFRFAVSGAPGVGKSTLIEELGAQIVNDGHKLAVLAIDPTSPVTHGAILGDKTRMDNLSRNPSVFIRPTPAGQTLGGVADRTREVIALCEAAGYDMICIETVGVGQSETEAHLMSDFFLLLVLPGGGDDLQGIKKGIVEMADLIAVTKCDGTYMEAAKQTQRHYTQAVHFFAPKAHGITTKVLTCSATERKNIDVIRDALKNFDEKTQASGFKARNRADQNVWWLDTRVRQMAQTMLLNMPAVQDAYRGLRSAVQKQTQSVSSAIGQLRQIILHTMHKQSGIE